MSSIKTGWVGPEVTVPYYNRAGIIPYFKSESDVYFVFSIWSADQVVELSDFGGSADSRYGESSLQTACRECDEESLGIFQISLYTAGQSYSSWNTDRRMVVLLTPLGFKWPAHNFVKEWPNRVNWLNQPPYSGCYVAQPRTETLLAGYSADGQANLHTARVFSRRYKAQENAGILKINRSQLYALLDGQRIEPTAEQSAVLESCSLHCKYLPTFYTPVHRHLLALRDYISTL